MRLWHGLNASGIGLRWSTLTLRIFGAFLMVLALAELVLGLFGEQSLSTWMRGRLRPPTSVFPVYLDAWVWLGLAVAGLAAARGSRWAEGVLARWPVVRRRALAVRLLGWSSAALAALWGVAVAAGWPWPLRAHALLALVAAGAVLALVLRGRLGSALNETLRRALPDTQGSGLWSGVSRRHIVERLVAEGDAARLRDGERRIILSACGLDSGKLTYFVNWPVDAEAFARSMGQPQDRVVVLDTPREVMKAAVASSALPLIFEPVRFRGERYVDGALFSNQPLRAAIAAGAEAALVVLLSSVHPRPHDPLSNLFSVGARLLEVSQTRDAEEELLRLPESWRAESKPSRVCVVRPARALEGGVLGFDPARHRRLIERGRDDAWRALEAAGWLERGE
jgi:predicted acylesterase/phospholipase RssA